MFKRDFRNQSFAFWWEQAVMLKVYWYHISLAAAAAAACIILAYKHIVHYVGGKICP